MSKTIENCRKWILRKRYKPQNEVCFQGRGHERQAHETTNAVWLPLGR